MAPKAWLAQEFIRAYDWFGGKTAQLQRARATRWETVATANLAKHGSAGQYAQTAVFV